MKKLNAELLKSNVKRKLQCPRSMIEIVLVLNRKCRLNSPRQPTVCYKCSDENLLFYSTITVLREIKKMLTMTSSGIIEIFTIAKVRSRTTEQIYKRNSKIVLFSCHFKRDYRRIHHLN